MSVTFRQQQTGTKKGFAGSFAQYEKARLVTKLRGARERIREASGKCEGRKSYAERDPELVLAANRNAPMGAPHGRYYVKNIKGRY